MSQSCFSRHSSVRHTLSCLYFGTNTSKSLADWHSAARSLSMAAMFFCCWLGTKKRSQPGTECQGRVSHPSDGSVLLQRGGGGRVAAAGPDPPCWVGNQSWTSCTPKTTLCPRCTGLGQPGSASGGSGDWVSSPSLPFSRTCRALAQRTETGRFPGTPPGMRAAGPAWGHGSGAAGTRALPRARPRVQGRHLELLALLVDDVDLAGLQGSRVLLGAQGEFLGAVPALGQLLQRAPRSMGGLAQDSPGPLAPRSSPGAAGAPPPASRLRKC